MSIDTIQIETTGERFYDITEDVKKAAETTSSTGVLYLFNQHTSCGLTINENYDSCAKEDLENFLKYLAPRNLSFIKHDAEGPDDSPSHMKSILLKQHIALPILNGKLQLGTWQGIFLCEFRDQPKTRKINIMFIAKN